MIMTSNRPYLIRAIYEWIVDNNLTPYMSVDTYYPGVEVPQSYVSDGQILLNLVPRAITSLLMDNEKISFSTRFGGAPCDIFLPIQSVVGIYAQENGQGMMFQGENPKDPGPSGPPSVKSALPSKKLSRGLGFSDANKKPFLKIVK